MYLSRIYSLIHCQKYKYPLNILNTAYSINFIFAKTSLLERSVLLLQSVWMLSRPLSPWHLPPLSSWASFSVLQPLFPGSHIFLFPPSPFILVKHIDLWRICRPFMSENMVSASLLSDSLAGCEILGNSMIFSQHFKGIFTLFPGIHCCY